MSPADASIVDAVAEALHVIFDIQDAHYQRERSQAQGRYDLEELVSAVNVRSRLVIVSTPFTQCLSLTLQIM
jgi:hypothetical protein